MNASSNNMSMNSLNTTSHNAERISALAEKLSQLQVCHIHLPNIITHSWVYKTRNFQNSKRSTKL